MHRPMPKVLLTFRIIEGPARFDPRTDMTRVGSGGGIPPLECAGARPVVESRILNASDKATAATHHEPAVPFLGEQHSKLISVSITPVT